MTKIKKALEIAIQYGGVDGEHHKTWVIDQMVRALCGSKEGEATNEYDQLVAEACDGEDGPETYGWDEGCPP